jgi:hypothetical protein
MPIGLDLRRRNADGATSAAKEYAQFEIDERRAKMAKQKEQRLAKTMNGRSGAGNPGGESTSP